MNPVAYTAWRRGMIVIALAARGRRLFVAGVNQTQAPKRLADAVAQAVAQRTGWEIEVGGARLTVLESCGSPKSCSGSLVRSTPAACRSSTFPSIPCS